MTDSYIGVPPQSGFISQEANQYFTGLTQNYIDLNQSISSLSSVIVLVNGVVQENSTMSLTSSTRITLGQTAVASDKITCIYLAKISSTQAPATGSVTSDMLSGSIANSKLANSSITLNGSAVSLGGSATVTPSVTPDNWQYFVISANQTMSANASTTISGWTGGAITGRLIYNLGTQYVTQSSGTFSFSTEGYYKVVLRVSGSTSGASSSSGYIFTTTDNSSYGDAVDVNFSKTASGGFNFYVDTILKITDTSNHKLRTGIYAEANNITVAGHGGNATRQRTYIRFERLGTTA